MRTVTRVANPEPRAVCSRLCLGWKPALSSIWAAAREDLCSWQQNFPFKDIVGVELSPKLSGIARKNAARFAKLYPNRTKVRIVTGNAAEFPIPPGDVVIFLYNPFEDDPMRKVLENVEGALLGNHRRIFIVYFNPKFRSIFDASRALVRRFAEAVRHTREELGFGWDVEDHVIVWQGGDQPPMVSS
jgi:hypothetical protein